MDLQECRFYVANFQQYVPQINAAVTSEWDITHKVTCLVTDGAANMHACAKEFHLYHTNCVAHTLNLLIKIDFFSKKSTTAKESSFISLQLSK